MLVTGVEVIFDDPEDDVAEDDVVIDVVLVVEPDFMCLPIPEGRLWEDTCPLGWEDIYLRNRIIFFLLFGGIFTIIF